MRLIAYLKTEKDLSKVESKVIALILIHALIDEVMFTSFAVRNKEEKS